MIVVRNVFRLKFGTAKEARKLWAEGHALSAKLGGHPQRALVDVTGSVLHVRARGQLPEPDGVGGGGQDDDGIGGVGALVRALLAADRVGPPRDLQRGRGLSGSVERCRQRTICGVAHRRPRSSRTASTRRRGPACAPCIWPTGGSAAPLRGANRRKGNTALQARCACVVRVRERRAAARRERWARQPLCHPERSEGSRRPGARSFTDRAAVPVGVVETH